MGFTTLHTLPLRMQATLLSYESANAAVGWLVVGVLLVVALDGIRSGSLLWAGLAVVIVAIAVLPAALSSLPVRMPAWEVLAIAAGPVLAHWLGVAAPVSTYLVVAALALVIAVELDAFTDVRMTSGFAVGSVVVVTMGVAALWTIAQYASDVFLDTALLVSQRAVMWDLVGATAIGLVAGVFFELYFRRVSPGHSMARKQSLRDER